MTTITITSGRLHSEFVRLLFLQDHRETDHFLQLQEFSLCILPVDYSTSVARRSPHGLRQGGTGNILVKTVVLRVNLNLDGSPITSRTHTHPSHSQTSHLLNLDSIFRCSSSPNNPVYKRTVNSSDLVLSLSSHRHSFIGLVFRSHFINSEWHNKELVEVWILYRGLLQFIDVWGRSMESISGTTYWVMGSL
jgi:hypothetical protein